MKVTQKNVRAFHFFINSDDEFFSYFKKNIDILRGYFILIHGNVTQNIKEYLEKESICYQDINGCEEKIFNISKAKLLDEKSNSHSFDTNLSYINKNVITLFNRPIRSGEEIVKNGDIIIKGRVNSGAKVIGNSNIVIFDTIDGVVECNGKYLILKNIGSGMVTFNSEELKIESSEVLKIIYLKDSKVLVKELI